jgi:predicted nucleic acid-binding protein
MDQLVFDTSTILNFGQRGKLQPLLVRFAPSSRLFTTPDVVAELTDPDHKDINAALLRDHFTVRRASTVPFDLATIARVTLTLNPGEISVMLLAKEIQATAVLDERPARREAASLGIKITGTLGLLHLAAQHRWMTGEECLATIRVLCAAGFYIRPPGANETFVEYHKSFPQS